MFGTPGMEASMAAGNARWARGVSRKSREPAGRVVEADEVAAALVVVGADLADEAVAEAEELGAAVEHARLLRRMVEGHRPLDRHLLVVADEVLEHPDRVEMLDRRRRVLGDGSRAEVRRAARVVVDRVVGEGARAPGGGAGAGGAVGGGA